MQDYSEIIQTFKRPFTDVKKLLIGIALSILPVVNFITLGYFLECSGIKKSNPGLPEWKNFRKLFVNGFFVFVIGLIYLIPAVIVLFFITGAALASLVATYVGGVIPPELIEGIAEGTTDPAVLESVIQNNWQAAIPTLVAAAPFLLVVIALSILAKFLIPMAALRFFETGKFKEAFNIRHIAKKAFTAKYLLAVVVAILVGVVVSTLLSFVPVVGKSAAAFIVGVISYTLFGAAYKAKGDVK